jgi:hypothetical protein
LASVISGAGVLLTLVALFAYFALHKYDPALSCDELWSRAYSDGFGGDSPPDIDAWDDWELTCDYWD